MSWEIEELGQVMFCRKGLRDSFTEMISKLDIKPPVVIKPNWSTSKLYTEAEILDWTLSALDCEKVVVESCAHYRSPIFRDHVGPFNEELEKRLAGQRKRDLKENDRWFLKLSGIDKVLKKHEVEYLNLSEELWSKQVSDPEEIRSLVDPKFGPLVNDIMYSMVPSKLHKLRGGTLLSLAKPKIAHGTIGVTLATKNLFGIISTPYRGKFHGKNDRKLNDSIMDINKICHSLFSVRGVVEALFTTSASDELLTESKIFRDLGFVWAANNIFELDAVVTSQLGLDIQEIGHLDLAMRTFGEISPQVIETAKRNPITLQ